MSSRVGHVWLVGAGPGDPRLITVAGLEALRVAEVVLYDRLAPPELLEECAADALLLNAGKAPNNHAMTQDEINAALVEHGLAGKRVVRLKGGDPYVLGRGGEEALALGAAGVPCTVIPGITSAIGGVAAGSIPVTHRGIASSFAVITGHEDPTKPGQSVDWSRMATAADTLIVLMGVGHLEELARAIIEGGRSPSTPAALVHAATTPRQRVVTAALETIAEVARASSIGAPSLLVVGDVVGLQSRIAAAAGPLAGKRVLITRTRRQASTLAELLLAEGAYPVLLPAIELERRADEDAFARPLARLRAGGYAWTVFTSANAVDTTLELLAGLGADARAFAGTRICAIGPGTAQALRSRGLIADLIPEEAIGESVVGALAEANGGSALAGDTVLLPRAEGGREVLPDGLRAAGAVVDEVRLYVAAPPAEPPAEALALVRAGEIDAVTFTSSSTVRNLAMVLGGDFDALRGALVACIGPSTAATASELGLTPDVVADEHAVPGLVDALRAGFVVRALRSDDRVEDREPREVAP